jgi:hypothetical protein
MYRLKKSVRPGQRVVLKENLKPTGRKIFLDTASQKQLKKLYEIGHSFVEEVKDKPEGEPDKEEEKISEKTSDKKIKIVKSGLDKS